VEDRPITEANHSNYATYLKEVDSLKMGAVGPNHGAPSLVSPAGPTDPISHGLPPTDTPKAVDRVWGRSEVFTGWFALSIRE